MNKKNKRKKGKEEGGRGKERERRFCCGLNEG
jgi:hypothetical protein